PGPGSGGRVVDFDAIKILGDILCSLLEPFIKVSLSLTEQVISLSRFAHLLYACYHNQRRSLMPNQLFYNSQTFTKNTIFCIKKQQKLDPLAPFFLLDVGDDALELTFAFARMCGGHNNTMNYKQSLDRLGAARDIDGVFARNPDLAHAPRRLNHGAQIEMKRLQSSRPRKCLLQPTTSTHCLLLVLGST
ncbi:hypothetical protein DEU56DRAFT_731779, partial [Suillus clintonianus]|uniref:uncharacterized protein n=1 Tax=Suillus clintonianus TaxID=1904413 RepID=UPI001B88568E